MEPHTEPPPATGEAHSSDSTIGADTDDEAEEDVDEEFDRRQYGIHQCLPVDDAQPDWAAGEPDSVEEYLRRVRHEAALLPAVVTSAVDPRRFDDRRTAYVRGDAGDLPPCPTQLRPSLRWVRQLLDKFAALRRALQREEDAVAGRVAGLPLRVADAALGEAARAELAALRLAPPSGLMPGLSELAGLEHVEVARRLEEAIRGVVEGGSGGPTPQQAQSIYSLSARVETPLQGSLCAGYRALLRRCATLRAEVADARDPLLPHLNVLIALAGCYFGQDEELAGLWEEGG